jgi:hypothetical protein
VVGFIFDNENTVNPITRFYENQFTLQLKDVEPKNLTSLLSPYFLEAK